MVSFYYAVALMPGSVSFNLINLGGLKIGSHASFSYSPARRVTKSEKLEAAELPLPFLDLTATPSNISLLSWHTSLSDFCGRVHEIGELKAWTEERGTISTKLLTGEGGAGKSRLAAEFCRRMRNTGWSAGFVDLTNRSTFRINEAGGLLVIDYPEESRPEVAGLLETLAKSEYPTKLRLLLLTRQPFRYWSELFATIRCEDIIDNNPIILGSIGSRDLFTVYQTTLERAAERFGTTPLPLSEQAFEAWVSVSPENSLPLFVMAAAVHAALYPNDPFVHYGGRDVVGSLVNREMSRLGPISESIGLERETVVRVLSFATLAGGLSAADVGQLTAIKGLGFEGIEDPTQLLATAGILSEGTVDAPKPDLLAAVMTAACLKDCPEDAAEWVWVAITRNDRLDAACNRVARVVHDEQMVSGGSASVVSSVLVSAVRGNRTRLRQLCEFFEKPDKPLSLAYLDEFIWRELASLETIPMFKAAVLNNLAVCLRYRGAHREAISVLQEADEIHQCNPGLFNIQEGRDDFERGLRQLNLARAYYHLGEYRNAIPLLQSSARYLRSASRAGFNRGEVELCTALDNLGRSLLRNGQKGGLKLVMEAVRIAKKLAETCPNSFEPKLATTLLNLGVARLQMKNPHGALAALAEAENIVRMLVQSHPGRHEHTLAIVLLNRAIILFSSRNLEGSVEAGEEAAIHLRAVNVATNGIHAEEEAMNLLTLLDIYAEARNWTHVADAAASYFRRREEYQEAACNTAADTEIARHLATAYLEMHDAIKGFRWFQTTLCEFPRLLQQIGPSDTIFEHARHTVNVGETTARPSVLAGPFPINPE
jgi:tetratricopeptide (TPR) repeat protein